MKKNYLYLMCALAGVAGMALYAPMQPSAARASVTGKSVMVALFSGQVSEMLTSTIIGTKHLLGAGKHNATGKIHRISKGGMVLAYTGIRPEAPLREIYRDIYDFYDPGKSPPVVMEVITNPPS